MVYVFTLARGYLARCLAFAACVGALADEGGEGGDCVELFLLMFAKYNPALNDMIAARTVVLVHIHII